VSETANANVGGSALSSTNSASVVRKEFSVTLFNVRVPVPSWSKHEFDITPKVIVHIVVTALAERLHHNFGKLEIQRVFAGTQELMIMDAFLTPVLCLLVENFAASIERMVFGIAENAIGMWVPGCNVIADNAVVTTQSGAVVVPMNWHCQGVSDKGAPCGAGTPIFKVPSRGGTFNRDTERS
jgi:hypothetical protein